jgi:hypothetical protein
MVLKTLLVIIVIIVRLLVSVKVISWIILRFISSVDHPISEIETYLVIILVDIWLTSSVVEIVIDKK